MKTINTERIPILVWGEAADEPTLAQARNLANLSFASHHVALMPDAHVGYGMPIGGVVACEGEVIPHAVGLDIGCGVRAWRTNIPAEDVLRARGAILGQIERTVPRGFDWHSTSQADRTGVFDRVPDVPALLAEIAKASRQIGTLGGGNHFIELQVDPEGIVWAMIHSGSRNVGKQMAEHYDRLARDVNRTRGSKVPPEWGLAHLRVDDTPGAEYLSVMNWCLLFARENRRLMAEAVQAALGAYAGAVTPDPAVDVHHNYAAVEEHFGRQLVVHRKGAVRARDTVIVPGSMGSASYIGTGKENPESFDSCSHGAGRSMGRKAARRALPVRGVLDDLAERDVILASADLRDIAEEAPQAYKDIEQVMRWQRDLVIPRIRLVPIAVVKG